MRSGCSTGHCPGIFDPGEDKEETGGFRRDQEDLKMKAAVTAIMGMLGACFGSYLLCVGERLAKKEKVIRDSSVCPSCGHRLSLPDLIPVISWVLLRGRCRYCKSRIPIRHIVTEILLAAVFILLYARFGLGIRFFQGAVLGIFLFTASVSDIISGEVDNRLLVIPCFIWIVTGKILPYIMVWEDCENPKEELLKTLLEGAMHVLLATVLCIVLLVSALFLELIRKKTVIGGADIKAFFLICLYLPLISILNMLVLTSVLSLIMAILDTFVRRRKPSGMHKTVPYVPILSGAAMVSFLTQRLL